MSKPVYERHIWFGSGVAATSYLSLEPDNECDEPVGYLIERIEQ